MSRWAIGWWLIVGVWEALLLVAATNPRARVDGWFSGLIAATVLYGLCHLCQALDADARKQTNSDAD